MHERDEHRPTSMLHRFRGVGAMLLAHAAALLMVLIVLCMVVPIQVSFFEDRDLELQPPTELIVGLAQTCVRVPLLIFASAIAADAFVLISLAQLLPRTPLAQIYSHLVLLGTTFALMFVSVWLTHPISDLVP